ncbi:Asp23/Gls24 family envelope stress response protein [Micromonospora sp. NPDC050495]|uniref:Asp23/Gls24 family envelope stress response protein n=1 Tax=Micromonospora sp. NPDC050495 TaxID=3154936 RepID=UPI0034005D82
MTGTLPRRGDAPARARAAPAARWAERRIARLAEDAAARTPAASAPAATVRVAGNVARVDLDLVVDHGAHLPAVAEAVRRRIADRVEAGTGLTVESVTVTVVDLRLPGEHRRTAGDRTARPTAGG